MPIRPEALIRRIDELWAALAEQSQGEEQALMRACSLTLIALVDEEDDSAGLSELLAELMRVHPSRAIVVRVAAGDANHLEADVRAHCWMPMGGREQICSEQIEIEASERTIAELPSVLLPLTAPDLPVILWCRGERAFRSPALPALTALAPRVIVDVKRFSDPARALTELAALGGAETLVTDLSWTRITRWREMMAQAFENPVCRRALDSFSRVEVRYLGEETAGLPASAFLMAAWLANGLGWSSPTLAAADSANGETAVNFVSASASARVVFRRIGGGGAGSRVSIVELGSANDGNDGDNAGVAIRLERSGDYLDVRLSFEGETSVSNRVWFPPSREGALLEEELKVLTADPVFEATLDRAAEIARLLS